MRKVRRMNYYMLHACLEEHLFSGIENPSVPDNFQHQINAINFRKKREK